MCQLIHRYRQRWLPTVLNNSCWQQIPPDQNDLMLILDQFKVSIISHSPVKWMRSHSTLAAVWVIAKTCRQTIHCNGLCWSQSERKRITVPMAVKVSNVSLLFLCQHDVCIAYWEMKGRWPHHLMKNRIMKSIVIKLKHFETKLSVVKVLLNLNEITFYNIDLNVNNSTRLLREESITYSTSMPCANVDLSRSTSLRKPYRQLKIIVVCRIFM